MRIVSTASDVATDDSDRERRAWRALWIGHSALTTRLEAGLQKAHGICLDDQLILMFLSEAESGRLRMSELAAVSVIPKSRLTYRIDHLVSRGLALRQPCFDDKRGSFAHITDAGLQLFHQARDTQAAELRRLLFAHASAGEVEHLGLVFERVLAAISGTGSPIRPNRR